MPKKRLIMAEKPSVAADIAKALGGFTRTPRGYFESDQFILSNGIGHLVEIDDQQMPKCEGKFGLDALPVIPPRFPLAPIDKTKSQFDLVASLMKRADVECLINACDAGREGELIFRYTTLAAGVDGKPMQRLWLQSMTMEGIREAFKHLRPKESMTPLFNAAISRSESDFLIGINGSRAMKEVKGSTLPVGRVQTPTLALIVDREERIRAFKPRAFYEVIAKVELKAGMYPAKWFDPNFKALGDELEQAGQSATRLWDRSKAEDILRRCTGQNPSSIKDESKPSIKAAPPLFDLTSLQREANAKFSFSAKKTLELAQALYEKHKVLTYPRTDSRALPEDYVPKVTQTMTALQTMDGLAPHAQRVLENGWIKPTKRIFDNTKISDHFAIVPTGKVPAGLDADEARIYDMVAKRFIAVFHPAAEFLVTQRLTVIANEHFSITGKVLTAAGWLQVYGLKNDDDDESPALPALGAGERGETNSVDISEGETKAPPRYNEGTLLSAMESAGKVIEDEALRDAMKDKGLGTPATRAATIEKLLFQEYIERQGKALVPQEKAFELIRLLREMDLSILSSPELTGKWEEKLNRMAAGHYSREQFMAEIADMTRHIVDQAKKRGAAPAATNGSKATNVACPACGQPVLDAGKVYRCSQCADFAIWKEIAGRQLKLTELGVLVTKGKTGELSGFRSKDKKPFVAMLKLEREGGESGKFRAAFEFKPRAPGDQPPAAGDARYPCPECKKTMVRRSKGDSHFWGCSGYPGCKHTQPDDNGKPGVRASSVSGRDSGHPPVRETKPSGPKAKIGDKCPQCSTGLLVQKTTRTTSKPFIGCNCYPTCQFFQWP